MWIIKKALLWIIFVIDQYLHYAIKENFLPLLFFILAA